MPEIKQEYKELFCIWRPLHNELVRLDKLMDDKHGEFNRIYVRSFFSFVESINYYTRQFLLKKNKEEKIQLSLKEINLLENKYLSIEESLKETYKIYSKCYNKTNIYQIYISKDKRYLNFKKAKDIRNNITHPKNAKDLFVSWDDITLIKLTHDWFYDFILELMEGEILI